MKESVIYQDILQQGLQQGLQRETTLVLRQLTRQVGPLNLEVEDQVRALPLEQLEALGEALLEFRKGLSWKPGCR